MYPLSSFSPLGKGSRRGLPLGAHTGALSGPQASTRRTQGTCGRRRRLPPRRGPRTAPRLHREAHSACEELVTTAGPEAAWGTGSWRPRVRPRPPRCCPHPGVCSISSCLQGQLLRVKNTPCSRESSERDAARFQSARCFVQLRARLAQLLRASLSRGPGPEGRKRSPFCPKLQPEPSPQSLAAPSTPPPAWPSAGLYFLPSQPHFFSQAAPFSSSTFSALSVSALSRGRAPGTLLPTFRPQMLALASRTPCGLALSRPVWGLARVSNHKYPLFLLTHTRWPLSTAQGRTNRVQAAAEKGGLFTQGRRHHPHAACRHHMSPAS